MRADLLALTADDLSVLSNRGLVKRAQRELESGELTCELTAATDGTITLVWSDACTCTLPVNRLISEGQCTCSATTICRHLIRSILAYQQQVTDKATGEADGEADGETDSAPATIVESTESEPAPVQTPEHQQPWNPGEISDQALARYFNPKQLKALETRFAAGLVVELIGSVKPTARFHSPAHTLRYLVPGDLRYTYCDCADPAPCSHVPLGIWAFRQLPDRQLSGIVTTNATPTPIPTTLLDDIETNLHKLFQTGISKLTSPVIGRLQRLEQDCRQQSLICPAEILLEILQEGERYQQRDARFSPTQLVELIGELCIRSDAIRNPTQAVPQLLIRGSQGDRLTDLGAARLVGLGTGLQLRQRNLVLTAYFQDTDSGSVMAFSRDFVQDGQDYSQLAQRPALKQSSLATLGASQLLLKSGKRSANLQLLPGRSPVTIHPQTYTWESLRAPLLVEDFSELRTHLSLLPPACLRPRRLTETLYVFAIASLRLARFNVVEQAVTAELYDQQQNCAQLYFPYHHHARHGTELLLRYLNQSQARFIAGQVQLRNGKLWIMPISLVFSSGTSRTLLQPWIATADQLNQFSATSTQQAAPWLSAPLSQPPDPLNNYLQRSHEAIAELLVIGLEQLTPIQINTWQTLYEDGQSLGFQKTSALMLKSLELMRSQAETVQWNYSELAAVLLQLALLMTLVHTNLV
jgi:hypothetical protein